MKDKIIAFFSSLISVALGMVTTFGIQGRMDRLQARVEAHSALEQVRTELAANLERIGTMQEYLAKERASALFFIENRSSMYKFQDDTIRYHGDIMLADASVSVAHDALDLLTGSSAFTKIGSDSLSMRIIRAYDTASDIADELNRHVALRNERFEGSINDRTVGQVTVDGIIDLRRYVRTPYGIYFVQWLAAQASHGSHADIAHIQDAIDAIDAFLEIPL